MSKSEKSEPVKSRKTYHSPALRYYGAIDAITATVGMTSTNMDGAKGKLNRTH